MELVGEFAAYSLAVPHLLPFSPSSCLSVSWALSVSPRRSSVPLDRTAGPRAEQRADMKHPKTLNDRGVGADYGTGNKSAFDH